MPKNGKNYFAIIITVAIIIALVSVLFLSNQPNSTAQAATTPAFGLDTGVVDSTKTVTSNSMTLHLTPTSGKFNDLFYLSFVGDSGVTITSITSPGTSAWTQRVSLTYSGTHYLQTYYAICPSSGSQITITINLNGGGNCVAQVFAVSGANTVSPFDGDYTTAIGTAAPTAATVSKTTSVTNTYIVGVLALDYTNTGTTSGFAPSNSFAEIKEQLASPYRWVISEGKAFTTAQTGGTAVACAWNSNFLGPWRIVAEAIKKAPSTSPSLATSPPGSAVVGTAFHDSATLTGSTTSAGGTVTYTLYSGTYPTGSQVGSTSLKTVTNHVVPDSDPFTVTSAGSYYFTASYSGDSSNNGVPVTSGEAFTVGKASPSLGAPSPSGAVVGTAFSATATLTGGYNAGGTATYTLYTSGGTQVGSPSTQGVSSGVVGAASFTVTSAGNYYIKVTYSGDSNNNPVSTPVQGTTFAVGKVSPSIGTTAPSGIVVGASFHDSATLTAATERRWWNCYLYTLSGNFPVRHSGWD